MRGTSLHPYSTLVRLGRVALIKEVPGGTEGHTDIALVEAPKEVQGGTEGHTDIVLVEAPSTLG